jgi:hypothetical protein
MFDPRKGRLRLYYFWKILGDPGPLVAFQKIRGRHSGQDRASL